MPDSTVGAGFARGLWELAVAKGAGAEALARQSGIDPAALQDQDARVPFGRYVALMRAAKALTGDPALALHYAETVNVGDVSIAGLVGLASETMADAFVQLNRYVRLVVDVELDSPGDRFRMTGDASGLWMIDSRKDPNAFPELTESALAQLVCGPRRFGDGSWVSRVRFTHADPGYAAEYERIFRAPVEFDADRNGLLLDLTLPQQPVRQLPRYAFGVLSARADELMRQLESTQTTRGAVERELGAMLHTGRATVDGVAARLGVSRQTLFRRLKAEGVTFERVLDDLRHRLALDFLGGRKVSVNETAYLVGFSDPAAFSRAFKRWTGMNPSAMRARSQGRS